MRRIRRTGAGVLVLTLVLGLGPPARAATRTATLPTKGERAVTLVTGDRVVVARDGQAVRVHPAPGRERIRFAVRREAQRITVIPADVVPMLANRRLDPRLFDVSGLLAAGYDDRRRDDLPLIVTYRAGLRASARPGATAAGVTTTRELSSVDGVALRSRKRDAAAFWSAVTEGTPAARRLRSGVTKLWLDGVRRPLLDRSVPQVGAPAAWQAGYTGAGVTVAVLDTGIDTSHPDLADRVVAARNFTTEPAGDQVGHGTHVASTVAGSGAASDGRYKGVAPGAKLLDGKVCGSVFCDESAILAGMEWAVEQGAKVVNLSLGGTDTPELDPLEAAVNRLSADRGTLFVVAAGNDGQRGEGTVGSPGSADAALTVGAADRDDTVAPFSSRGPRTGDHAIKPDLTAPGVGIAAARVKGTPAGDRDPVDDHYARLSGTSMATPHVAGAAAILAQQHPDWRGERLKATLTGSAVAKPGVDVFAQGAGRLDVARAVNQTVSAAPTNLSLGMQQWPHTDDEPVRKEVSFHNGGQTAVTLTLRFDVTGPDGKPAPDGMFTVDAATVTVPAGGTASVTATADTRVAGPDGRYTGRLVASSGGTAVTVPVAIEREVESYELTARFVDRDGAPTANFHLVVGLPGFPGVYLDDDGDGAVTIRLPKGEYSALAFINTWAGESGTIALLGAPALVVERDTAVTFDARAAKPVDVSPPRSSAELASGEVLGTMMVDAYTMTFIVSAGLLRAPEQETYEGIFTGQVGARTDRERFVSCLTGDWAEPGPDRDFADSPYVYHLSWCEPGRMYDGMVRRPRDGDLASVRNRYAASQDRVARTEAMVRPAGNDRVLHSTAGLPLRVPATRTDYFTTDGVEWMEYVERFRIVGTEPQWEASQSSTWRTYRPGSHDQRWMAGVFGPTFPPLPFSEVWVRQWPEVLSARVPLFTDGGQGHFAGSLWSVGGVATDSARTTLYRDGVEVARSDEAGYVGYEAPAANASYRLDTDATQSVFDTSTRITASWQFRSRAVTDPAGVSLPLMAVRYAPRLDDASRAPGGVPYVIPVTVERQPGAPAAAVRSLTVEVSYDDGATWRRVPLAAAGGGWIAPVVHPDSGYVSLRAKAVDADGNSVEQTIIRAYGLRAA